MQKEDFILQPAQLSWHADDTPVANAYGDVYFSAAGGLAESEYVFLRHNQLPARFVAGQPFTVVETGFGTGLNCLLAADHWLRTAPASGQLHLISFEKHPLRLEDLKRAQAGWKQLAPLTQALQAGYPPLLPGWHFIRLADNISLWLWLGDVHAGLADLDVSVDAWFLDGFAPAKNPEMWTEALFQQMARLSYQGTTFATFTAAGAVRRGLQAVGFQVEKVPGFGRKREMLCGRFAAGTCQTKPAQPRTLAVVGAGLAGAAVAHRAAQAGVAVTVFEAEQPACAASGNRAGVFHPLITADWSLRSQWYQLALEMLVSSLPEFFQAGVEGALAPVLHWPVDEKWQVRFERFAARFPHSGMSWQTAPCGDGKVWRYHQSGWLAPPTLVQYLLAHENIHLVQGVSISLEADKVAGQVFDAIVVATGARLPQGINWPQDMVRPVAGQVDVFKHACRWPQRAPWVHSGYTVAVSEHEIVSGATFVKHAPFDTVVSKAASTENLARVQQVCAQRAAGLTPEQARVSVRPTTRDHMPIIGVWSKRPNVGVTLGHGARGIVSVLLGAQWVLQRLGVVQGPLFKRYMRMADIQRFV